MKDEKEQLAIENIYFLSALLQYNSERSALIQKFYDHAVRNRLIFQSKLSLQDIKVFGKQFKPHKFEWGVGLLEDYFLIIPTVKRLRINRAYLAKRYDYLDDPFSKVTGFPIGALVDLEMDLRHLTLDRFDLSGEFDKIYAFKTIDKYSDLQFIANPSRVFLKEWRKNITLTPVQILATYRNHCEYMLASVPNITPEKVFAELKGVDKEANTILDFLSLPLDLIQNYSFHYLHKPLIQIRDSNTGEISYLAPYPHVFGTTTDYRVDNAIQNSPSLKKTDDSSKGVQVEYVADKIISFFPNINYVKNYQIKNTQIESDILLLLNKSVWAVEVKSHSILRKIPSKWHTIRRIFIDKVKKGYEQGVRMLEKLPDEENFLHSLNCPRGVDGLERGVVILLDGLIPTFYPQHTVVDQVFKTDEISAILSESYRIYIISVYELQELALQPNASNFEEFLLWRTGYPKKFPLFCYDERDYWTYYNSTYLDRPELFNEALKKGVFLFFVGNRFSDKSYLKKIGKLKRS